MTPKRVLCYVRVSGQEQGRHGTSLDGQREHASAFCKLREWPAPTIYIEVESAGDEKIERRTELHRLIKDAGRGDVVLAPAVDRWSRDIVFGVDSVRKLIARGVGWFSISENIDASTPQGDSTLGIMSWVADQERKRIKARTVGRKRELRAQGHYVEGKIPFGYRRAGRKLEPVEDEARIVREIFRMAGSGCSLREIAAAMTRETGDTWKLSRVHDLLGRRVYLGEIWTPDGKVTKGTHEPIVDQISFDRAHVGMERRRRGERKQGDERARTRLWLMVGMAYCADCGARMAPAYGNGIDYYACAGRIYKRGCVAKYLRVDATDAKASEQIVEHLVELRHAIAKPSAAPAQRPAKASSDARRKRLQAQLERATTLAIEGAITAAELKTQRERIERELSVLLADEQAAAKPAKVVTDDERRALLGRVDKIRKLWAKATPQVRRQMLQDLAKSVRMSVAAGLTFEWRTVEELAEEAVDRDE